MMARKVIGKLIKPEFLVEGRLKKVHGNVELKQEGRKDGIGIEELSNVKESVCECI